MKKNHTIFLGLNLFFFIGSQLFAKVETLPVLDFDKGIETLQGGEYYKIHSGSSSLSYYLHKNLSEMEKSRSLKISYQKAENGTCEFHINLFADHDAESQKNYLDVSSFPYLRFKIKGESDHKNFDIRLSDREQAQRKESVLVGPVSKFLNSPTNSEWKTVVMSSNGLDLDQSSMAKIIFDFNKLGSGTIFIDDITFTNSANTAPPQSESNLGLSETPFQYPNPSHQETDKSHQKLSEPTFAYNGTKEKEKGEDRCELLPIWNFDKGIVTDQNGDYNQFEAGKSEAKLSLTRKVKRGNSGRSLKIEYSKQEDGFCGLWFHLFDEQELSLKNRFIDTTDHPYLSFWVKGVQGGEDFTIQMADLKWFKKEDSKPGGFVSTYLKGKISTEWQEVVVPLDSFQLGTSQLSTLVLNFTETGNGTVYIDDLNFKNPPGCVVPYSRPAILQPHKDRELNRAMWVWEIRPLLFEVEYRNEFFSFCERHKINELFLQLPYVFVNDLTAEVECRIEYPTELRKFIKLSREKGILIHALDGYPEFVLTEHHPRVLAQVRAILAFNKNSADHEKFYGIHLDNEPYQLLGFENQLASTILLQFLDLNQKIMDFLRESESDLVYGIDIPFWFDEAKNEDGKLKYSLEYKGENKNAAFHLIDIVDNIGIMDYRNFAGGADGMIRHGEGEVKYANKMGKKIYLGVETFKYQPSKVSFIYSRLDLLSHDDDQAQKMLTASRIDNFPVRTIKTAKSNLVGLVQPQTLENRLNFNAAITNLFKLYGPAASGNPVSIDDLVFAARTVIGNNPKYEGFDPFLLEDPKDNTDVPGFDTTERMLSKITFAGKSKNEMEEVLLEVGDEFREYEHFVGFAIHYYQTYRTMPD